MSSSVFFRFKSQKEPSRVAFDGTGISVFELKREIITLNRLGDGTDFELLISSQDTNEGMPRKNSLSSLDYEFMANTAKSTMTIHQLFLGPQQ